VVHWQTVALLAPPLVLGIPIGAFIGGELFAMLANTAALLPARRARRLEGPMLLQAA
jgi:uncharacterized integral membrane protein